MTEMKKQFEDWFFSEIDGGTGTEELCWQAWQASRAAIVVKLPESFWGKLSELDSTELRLLSSSEGIRYE